jgi:hypothetical protein
MAAKITDPAIRKAQGKKISRTRGKSCTASAKASLTTSIFFIQRLLIKVSNKIKKNLAPLIVAQFSKTFTRMLIDIRKNSNTGGAYC